MARKRMSIGTLVASTNPLRHIQAKRLVKHVVYKTNYKIISEHIMGTRSSILQ